MSRPQSYWRIEISEHFTPVYRRFLPGNLSDGEIIALLQRLACRQLTNDEILACSIRKPHKSLLLEPRIDSKPRSKRYLIWLPDAPSDYTASYWRADELTDMTEIGRDH